MLPAEEGLSWVGYIEGNWLCSVSCSLRFSLEPRGVTLCLLELSAFFPNQGVLPGWAAQVRKAVDVRQAGSVEACLLNAAVDLTRQIEDSRDARFWERALEVV